MSVVAGVDIGNATTEVIMLDGERLLGADRLPTRGRKGSADSLRGAAALVRRMERRLAVTAGEARIAPLRAVGTATLTIPAVVPDTGRLRVLAAGVATPGGAGTCVGRPLWLDGRTGLAGRGVAGPGAAGAAGRGGPGCPPGRPGARPRRLRGGGPAAPPAARGRDPGRGGPGRQRRGCPHRQPSRRPGPRHRPGRRGRGRRLHPAGRRGAPAGPAADHADRPGRAVRRRCGSAAGRPGTPPP